VPVLGEVFRDHGFDGASLALISARTGLGKGSLYHFFPGGKDEMADAVLADIDGWFEANIFAPLRDEDGDLRQIDRMFAALDRYFRSGRRVCLAGVFALGGAPDPLGARVRDYFAAWIDALAAALARAGLRTAEARHTAEDVVAAVQGALVLARGVDDPALFARVLARSRRRLAAAASLKRRPPGSAGI
jgi:TetR/AcrR family transcriptional repressor of lmrAB and yxaGH operons